MKFDFLGLKTLTVIQNAMDLLALRGIKFDINLIPLDDKPSYDLYASAPRPSPSSRSKARA